MALKELVILILLGIGTTRALSYSCNPCDDERRQTCIPKLDHECPAGTTRSLCGCCNDKCLKDVGEHCGGFSDNFSATVEYCGKGLRCSSEAIWASGTCIRDECLSLSPSGFWTTAGVANDSARVFAPLTNCNEYGSFPTEIYLPRFQCCHNGTGNSENPREFVLDFERFIVLDEHMGTTWQEARNLCQKSGYELAQPSIVVTYLASYLHAKYNHTYYWLGGKGNGSHIAYLNGQVVDSDSPLWRVPYQGFQSSTNFCMYLREDGNPNPLGTYNCQDTHYMTPLCEVN